METQSTVKPIRPDEVTDIRVLRIPGTVVEVFNQLIADHFDGKRARILQNEAVEAVSRVTGLARHEVFNNSYLDVEPLFIKAGWDVEYHKPLIGEEFEAYFLFRVKP